MSEDLARKLKAARKKLGLSQSQVAKEWGMPRQTIINWEQNKRTPRGFTLTAITEKLDRILAE